MSMLSDTTSFDDTTSLIVDNFQKDTEYRKRYRIDSPREIL